MTVAAIVHAEIAHSSAFSSHLGEVARAAEHIVQVESGVDPPLVTVPEAGHAADAYRSALDPHGGGAIPVSPSDSAARARPVPAGAELSPLAR